MKQTLKEATSEYIEKHVSRNENASFSAAFKAGAEWQENQSPWISVKERLPKDFDPKLILLKDEQVRIALLDSYDRNDFEIIYFWYDREADESFYFEDVVAWMPIPSFDEILEANRDVLKRIKEKGD